MTPQPTPAAARPTSKKPHRAWIWITALAIPVVAALTFGFYLAFAAFIPDPLTKPGGFDNQEIAAQELEIARMEAQALRNALAATGGLGVLVALAVTIRRQFHHEQATREAQAAELRRQEHLEQKAADEKDDTIQRRITDARVRAVEQLGSDNPAVRIGGLHNLERIGQQHAELRQVVLDEICSYLRLPYTPPEQESKARRLPIYQFEPIGPPPAEASSDEAEGEVRLIAQEILKRHLNPDREDLYWEHSRLNLRRAHLKNIDFYDCHLTGADFTNATFTGDAVFQDATFGGYTYFGDATFRGGAFFTAATFTGHAFFGSTTFTGDAYFVNVTFGGRANFKGMRFDGAMDFEQARFQGVISANSPALLEALRRQGVRLRIEAEHQLPEGWGLDPTPTDLDWGHLTNQTATAPG